MAVGIIIASALTITASTKLVALCAMDCLHILTRLISPKPYGSYHSHLVDEETEMQS